MPVKLTPDEDLYFAREQAETLRRLCERRREEMMAEEREQERKLHYMKCPKCGMQLEEISFGDVHVDKCFSCEGMWLDHGELDRLSKKDAGFLDRLFELFR